MPTLIIKIAKAGTKYVETETNITTSSSVGHMRL